MRVKLLTLVLIFALYELPSVHGVLSNIVVKAYCSKYDTHFSSKLVIYANGETLGDVYGLDVAGNQMDGCSTVIGVGNPSEFTGNGTDASPLILSISMDPDTLTSTPICHHTVNLANKRLDWTYRITDPSITNPGGAGSNPISFGDFTDYSFSCEFSTMAQSQPVASFNINDGQNSREAIVENADLLVVNPDDPTDHYSSFVEGMNVRLKAVMVPIDNGATGLSPYSCFACGVAGCPSDMPRIALTDDAGCPTAYLTNTDNAVADGFTGTEATSLLSGVFEVGAWAGQDFVIFTCKLDFCYDGDDLGLCKDRCGYYAQQLIGRRRKRDLSSSSNYTNLVIRSRQSVQSLLTLRRRDDASSVTPQPIFPKRVPIPRPVMQDHDSTCVKRVFFLATINVLGILTMVSVITLTVACLKYRKMKRVD